MNIRNLLKLAQSLPGDVQRYGTVRTLNTLQGRLEAKFQRTHSRSWPSSIIIEPHTFCNLSCINCATGQGRLVRPRGKMPFQDFRLLIQQLAPRVKSVHLTGMCEPMLYEDCLDYMECITGAGLELHLETNGHFFRGPDFVERFLRARVSTVNIDVDGKNQKTLEAFRGPNADLERVLKGVRLLLATRKRLGLIEPIVNLQFIVTRLNEHQIGDFMALQGNLKPNSLSLKAVGLDLKDQDKCERLIPLGPAFRRYLKERQGRWRLQGEVSNRCAMTYARPMICWDGTLVPCCYDFAAEFAFGNVFEQSFSGAWNSARAVHFRKSLAENRWAISICTGCPEGRHPIIARNPVRSGSR